MEFVLEDRHSPPTDNALVRPTSIHNDKADPCFHEPTKQHQQLRFLAAPPPSPQDASLLDSVFAAKRHHGKLPCSLQARANSSSDMDKDQQQEQQQQETSSSPMQQHAKLLSRLLQQTASSSSSMSRHYTPKQHKHHYHGVSVLRRHVGSTHKHHRSGHVQKPSRIPIISSRLRARAALHKATNDLADAIATVHLSSPGPKQHNNGDNVMAEQ